MTRALLPVGTALAGALALALLAGCVINKRPLEIPKGDAPAILLVSTNMPEPIANVGRHAWFVVRGEGETRWQRVEFGGFGSGVFGGNEDVRLHAVWRGRKAQKAIECLRANHRRYRPDKNYLPWPGPNSNTFVEALLRKCNLHADLPPTAVGKDYRGLIGVSFTSGGTGVQLETPIAGIKLGLTEGIELHLFAFAFGIDLWPPAIIVPLGAGRIGFDDW